MKKYQLTIIGIIALSIIIPTIIIYQLLSYKKIQLQSLNEIMLQEAKSHFDNVDMTRQWSSKFGSVYVKKNANIEPNQYLKDNHSFNKEGEMLVKVNHAWMTRQLSELSNANRDYYFKITSLNPMNPDNAPDEFETKGLKTFETNKHQKYYYEQDLKSSYFHFIGSLRVEASCLECHSHQGYKLGDIRGGIRVSIPIQSHNGKINEIEKNTIISISIVIISAFIINILLIRSILSIVKHNERYQKLNQSLEIRIREEVEKNNEKEKILAQQSKMAALGEMLNNIAHQWRQPLSTITTATSGMQLEREMGMLNDEEFDKNTQLIMDQAAYMSKTIDDFKNFFKSDKEQIEFDLKDLVIKDIELIKSSYSGQNISIDIEGVVDHLRLFGYPNELSQAILNILNNAKDQYAKFTQDHNQIKISTSIEDNIITLTISDNAGGVPEDIIDKIFEPYFTTKHKSQGTGIGLYMTQKIIEDHLYGSIRVENKEMVIDNKTYQGASFIISLPILSEID